MRRNDIRGKKRSKKFNDYLKDWWRGNLNELESDPRYKEYLDAIKQENSLVLFTRNLGSAYGVREAHKEYVKQIYAKYK